MLTWSDLHIQLQGVQKPPLSHFTDIETQAQDLRLIGSKFHALGGSVFSLAEWENCHLP